MSSKTEHKESQLSQLIELLQDGECHSGQKLADRLSVSRAYVWKLIQQLQDYGLELESVSGKGYLWLSASSLLNDDKFKSALSALGISYDYSLISQSTNEELKNNFCDKHLVAAEYQEAGRGRRGRNWQSPMATNLYFSYGWKTELPVQQLGGLSLVVGISMVEALEPMGFDDLKLKWPNDVRFAQKKLAGILIELNGDASGDLEVIIGVGLNVNMQNQKSEIDQDWTSLAILNGKPIARQNVLLLILEKLQSNLKRFEQNGFISFQDAWNCYDETLNKEVTIIRAQDDLHGVAKGVDDTGALLLEADGELQTVYAGEVSLRVDDVGSVNG